MRACRHPPGPSTRSDDCLRSSSLPGSRTIERDKGRFRSARRGLKPAAAAARPRFERKDAGDDLQAVADAMLYLLQQRFLLLQQIAYLPFGVAAIGDIFDCQKNELAGVSLEK